MMLDWRSQRLVLVDWSASAGRQGDCEGDIGMGVGDLVRCGVGGTEGTIKVHVREQMAQVGDEHLGHMIRAEFTAR